MDTLTAGLLTYYETLPLPKAYLRSALEAWVMQQRSRCADPAFSAHFPWRELGLPQNYFLQRHLIINGKHFLTGPRYRGGDIRYPFIDLVAFDAEPDREIAGIISQEWAEMKPQSVRVLTPENRLLPGKVDQYIYGAAGSDLMPLPETSSVTIRPAFQTEYAWCCHTMAQAYHPARTLSGLADRLKATSESELEQHIAAGNVYIVLAERERAGFILCEKSTLAFLNGYCIREEVIAPAFQGRSLASQAQRLLYHDFLQRSRQPVLLAGTILPENIPSIRTAEKAGRVRLLTYQFLPV